MEPLLIGVAEACKVLGLGRTKFLGDLVYTGKIRSVKIGRRILFAPEDLQRYVDSLLADG